MVCGPVKTPCVAPSCWPSGYRVRLLSQRKRPLESLGDPRLGVELGPIARQSVDQPAEFGQSLRPLFTFCRPSSRPIRPPFPFTGSSPPTPPVRQFPDRLLSSFPTPPAPSPGRQPGTVRSYLRRAHGRFCWQLRQGSRGVLGAQAVLGRARPCEGAPARSTITRSLQHPGRFLEGST